MQSIQSCSADSSPIPSVQGVSEALRSCPGGLRLGFHSASSSTNVAAAHGVAAALHEIHQSGGLANASYRPVGYSRGAALRAGLELIQNDRVHAVVGGGSSAISIYAQSIFALAGIPQVAHSSTAVILSDRASFPTFSRVVPPDSLQGDALAVVSSRLGWLHVAVVSSSDEYGRGLAFTFISALRRNGGRALLDISSGSGDGESAVVDSVAAVRAVRARVVALFVSNREMAREWLLQAAKQAVSASYLAPDSWLSSISAMDVSLRGLSVLGTNPFSPSSGAQYQQFVRHWRAAPPVPHPELQCDQRCRERPAWAGMYAYDATRLIFRAWSIAQQQGLEPHNLSSGSLLSAIRSVGLPDGLTSNLSILSNGEPSTGFYDLMQFGCSNLSTTPSLRRVGTLQRNVCAHPNQTLHCGCATAHHVVPLPANLHQA